MYARSTTIRGNPQSIEEGIRYVRDEVMPAVQRMDGCIGLSMLADRETGHCIITSSWRDEERMRSSAEGVRGLRERAAQIFGGQPEVHEWELGLWEPAREAPDDADARVTWTRADPGNLDRVVEAYRDRLVP